MMSAFLISDKIMENELINLLKSFGIPVFAIVLLFIILKYYGNAKQLLSDISYCFSWMGAYFRRNAVKSAIEAQSSKTIAQLDEQCPELNLPGLKLEWVKNDDEIGKCFNNTGTDAIVCLKFDRDNTQNIINTTSSYVRKNLLPIARPYIEPDIIDAIDHAVILNFLGKSENHDVVITRYVQSNISSIVDNSENIEKVKTIDAAGLLTRIALREYSVWGANIVGTTPTDEHNKDSRSFLDFVYNIADREYDDYTPLRYKGKDIKVGVLLVAKSGTYFEAGAAPYLRRIREGFADGIKTFYLLARNEKIDYLQDVYSELITSGNFELKNGPIEYLDREGRRNICYCIEVLEAGEISTTVKELDSAIDTHKQLEATITRIYPDSIECSYKGIFLQVPREEVTTATELVFSNYYKKGMAVFLNVKERSENNQFVGSFLNTKSNPQKLIDNNYQTETIVRATVEYVDDDFLKARVNDTDIECVAFRRDLTYSRYQFLHHLFSVGAEYDFVIKEIDYLKPSLIVSLANLKDPWENVSFFVGQNVNCGVMQKNDLCIKSELGNGYFAILPYSELSWFEDDIDQRRKTIRLGDIIPCNIKSIDKEKRLIVLTAKANNNPYKDKYKSLTVSDYIEVVKFDHLSNGGIVGYIDNKYQVFIPENELILGGSRYHFSLGRSYNVYIKCLSKSEDSFIGSMTPFIETPLKRLSKSLPKGELIKDKVLLQATSSMAKFKMTVGNERALTGLLFVGDITKLCHIESLERILESIPDLPIYIKDINVERDAIFLSHKIGVPAKIDDTDLEYGIEYESFILGKSNLDYIITINDVWLQGKMPCEKAHSVGDIVNVILTSKNGEVPYFVEC